MEPISALDISLSHAHKISLQRRLAVQVEKHILGLSVATGIVAVLVLFLSLSSLVFYILS